MKKRFVKLIATVIFIGLFVWFYATNPDAIKELASLHPAAIASIILLQFLTLVLNDLTIKTIIAKLGTKLNFSQGLFAAYISSFGNYFLPLSGGAALRAVYLKRNHNFSYKKFISMMYGMYIVSFLATSSVVLVSMAGLYVLDGLFVLSLYLLMAFLFLFTLSLSSARIRVDDVILRFFGRFRLSRPFVDKANKVTVGWKQLTKERKLVIKLLSYALLNIFTRAIMYFIAFQAIGIDINFLQALIYNSIISLSLYLTVTPGSIGIRETMLLLFGTGLFFSDTAILAVSLIDRASLILLLLGLFVWFHFVKRERIKL